MRLPITIVFVVAALYLGAANPAPGEKSKGASIPKTKVIPLESIYSTNGQKGLLRMEAQITKVVEWNWEAIRKGVSGGGPNILMLAADNNRELISATRNAFTTGASAESAVNPDIGDKPKPTSFWMVAFLGINSSRPPAWLVLSAEQKGRVIRLSVSKPKRERTTLDFHHYFIWVPLGKLEAGRYTLELFDSKTKEITLMRQILVSAK